MKKILGGIAAALIVGGGSVAISSSPVEAHTWCSGWVSRTAASNTCTNDLYLWGGLAYQTTIVCSNGSYNVSRSGPVRVSNRNNNWWGPPSTAYCPSGFWRVSSWVSKWRT